MTTLWEKWVHNSPPGTVVLISYTAGTKILILITQQSTDTRNVFGKFQGTGFTYRLNEDWFYNTSQIGTFDHIGNVYHD